MSFPSLRIGLFLAVIAAALLMACGDGSYRPTPAPSGPTAGPVAASAATAAGGAPGVPGAPAGYERSCAQFHPWGRPVQFPFVCVDEPRGGQPQSSGILARGYAGGSAENKLTVELRDSGGRVVLKQSLTYRSPDPGAPGPWEATVPIPRETPPGPARFAVYFTSPRDGSIVAEGLSDIIVAGPTPVATPAR